MKAILSNEYADVLVQFARARALVAFDYDGTLTPIAESRHAVEMRKSTHSLLQQVTRRYPCAVISGRKREDICARLEGIEMKYVIGNHGLEPDSGFGGQGAEDDPKRQMFNQNMNRFESEIVSIAPELERSFARRQGIDIENKQYSLSVHYRQAKDQPGALELILESISRLPRPMRVVLGKLVVNVIPPDAPHKGDALVALREQEGVDVALFVGDDVTDEDVFAMNESHRFLCIRIGDSPSSAAPWYLRDQDEMDGLLERLVALRA